MIHANGHAICAIDCETTGLDPDHHEIIEIAFLPLDFNLQPRRDVPFFEILIRPDNVDNIDWDAFKISKQNFNDLLTRGLDKYDAADLFVDWWSKLKLAYNKRIMPLAHNWAFDMQFIKKWLGPKTFHYHIDGRYRDTMNACQFLNDISDKKAEQTPFPKVNLTYVAQTLKIPHTRAHTAMGDCLVTAEVYRELIGALGQQFVVSKDKYLPSDELTPCPSDVTDT